MEVEEWIIYCRISDDREKTHLGVDRQERLSRKLHATRGLGGTVLCVLVDNDLTAATQSSRYKGRPAYDRLAELLREKPGGRRGVITYHDDRLHRSSRELEDFIDLIMETDAPIETVRAGRMDLTNPTGRAQARTTVAWAQQTVEHGIDKLHDKIAELAEAGAIANGGPRPFGFDRIFSGKPPHRHIERDEVNPAEAAIIRECARRALAGDPLRSIVRWLNNNGHVTSTGGPWSQQGLRTMLVSGRIAGLRERHGVVVAKAVWPAIIPAGEHEQLRALLMARERPPGSRVRKHYLSGYVFCSDCVEKGVKMRVGPQAGKLKYKCFSDVGGCNGRVIGLADLEELVDKLMVSKLSDPKTLRELAMREDDRSNVAAELLERIEADERRLKVFQVALDEAGDEELPEVIGSVRTIRRRLADARGEWARITAVPAAGRESFPELAERWGTLDLDQRQGLLRLFVDRILIYPAQRGLARFDPTRVKVVPVARARARARGGSAARSAP